MNAQEPDKTLHRPAAMKTVRRTKLVGASIFVLLAAWLAACSTQVPVPFPVATGPLMTVEFRGGLCAAGGTCGTTYTVERDGRVHLSAKPPNDLGTVPPNDLAALDAAIRATDFTALKSHPFTGQCPTTFDGQELVFEFGAPNGVQRIATCEVEVDFGSPLFVAMSTALGPLVPLPTT